MAPSDAPPSTTSAHLSETAMARRIAARVAERNSWDTFRWPSARDTARLLCAYLSDVVLRPLPSQTRLDDVFPVSPVDFAALRRPPADGAAQLTWVGHATVFAQVGGVNVLTDPVFSRRCSAVQWMGPERYRRPAFVVGDLVRENVPVDVVLISHNHYDHLDHSSVRDLADLGGITFVVPLGLRRWFAKHVPRSLTGGRRVVELDWHESCDVGGVSKNGGAVTRVTAVPMQHWSNRVGYDRDRSLWCGFAVTSEPSAAAADDDADRNGVAANGSPRGTTQPRKFLFVGDTGWFEGLRDIGKKYGPFDLAAIPIGAYEPASFMRPAHMNPEEAVRTMYAVESRRAVPIHWGTFRLTVEDVMEPRERLVTAFGTDEMERERFKPWYIGDTMCFR